MRLSLRQFGSRFQDLLLDLHWRQWRALGVSTQIEPSESWFIDLEALVNSTLAVGLEDRRLLGVALEWLTCYGSWVNRSRLKRIGRAFTQPVPPARTALVPQFVLEAVDGIVSACGPKDPVLPRRLPALADAKEWVQALKAFRSRGVIGDARFNRPVLLQLTLRGMLGMDARAEVLAYLLANPRGNSRSISQAAWVEQKSVYRTLERWIAVGLVAKTSAGYALARKDHWRRLLSVEPGVGWLNWPRAFRVLDSLFLPTSSPSSTDTYLVSSLFRDAYAELNTLSPQFDPALPDPARHPGKGYFEPFAEALLMMLRRMRGLQNRQ